MGKKIVFVTGANKGIGFGIAKHLGLSVKDLQTTLREIANNKKHA